MYVHILGERILGVVSCRVDGLAELELPRKWPLQRETRTSGEEKEAKLLRMMGNQKDRQSPLNRR